MTGFKDRNVNLDALLARIAESIQLDDTRKERMESAYNAIDSLFSSDDIFWNKVKYEIYPQGSVKIGTTIKPQGVDEFDLDIVVHIQDNWQKYTSSLIYGQLKRVLSDSSHYSERIELKNRCIRVNYSGDFHMDILPGVQEFSYDPNTIKIPDRELHNWVSSNPRGYADWFLEKASTVRVLLLEKAFAQEDLDLEEFAKKEPLKRAVQLLKMYRNEFFKSDPDYKTSSIIITTLAAQFYGGEPSIYETIENVINQINKQIYSRSILEVLNPKNSKENFAEEWKTDSNLYKRFCDFNKHMMVSWIELRNDNQPENERILKSLFSERSYNLGLEAHNNFFARASKIKNKDFSGLEKLAEPKSNYQKPYFR
jgi:hypothetical protein